MKPIKKKEEFEPKGNADQSRIKNIIYLKCTKIPLSITFGAVYCIHYYLAGARAEVSFAVVFISQLWVQFV